MKNIKALAFDLDGTLLELSGESISDMNVEALQMAHKQGIEIILATGRPVIMVLPFVEKIGCISYVVSNNGASLYDVKNKVNLSKNFLPKKLFEQIANIGKETKSFFALHTTEDIYRANFFNTSVVPSWVKSSVDETGLENSMKEIENAIERENITQLTLKNSKDTVFELKQKLQQEFNGEYSLCIGNEYYLDINPKNTSKLTGIVAIIKLLNIDISEVVAFGDSGNDVQMLAGVGYGIAMGNGTINAKEAAKETIGDHNGDSLAKKIRELIS